MRLRLAITVITLLLLPATASAQTHDIELRVHLDSTTATLSGQWGAPLIIAEADLGLWIVPKVDVTGVTLEVFEVDGLGELRPLTKTPLPPWGHTSLPLLDGTVELISYSVAELSLDADFRPRSCCIFCGQQLHCGGCASNDCGSCCVE
ncbi:MAG: hypothetical protein AAF604_04685 [Acidobacteriota bacterium]